MITRVRLEYFKRFGDETFEIGDNIVLAGPNNSGKTTLLQAISVWHFGFQKWLAEHAESSQAKQRIGVPVTRKDFTAIPLREMDLLWSDRSTAFSKGEKEGVKPGRPKLVSVTVWGKNPNSSTEWCLGVSFRYTSKEQVYVKLIDEKGQPNRCRSCASVFRYRRRRNRAKSGLSEHACRTGQTRRYFAKSSS